MTPEDTITERDCDCLYEPDMLNQVPYGSHCGFCQRPRFESKMKGPEFDMVERKDPFEILQETILTLIDQKDEARQIAGHYYKKSLDLQKDLNVAQDLLALPGVRQAIHMAAMAYADSSIRH